MRTSHWIALIGSIAAMTVFACSSTDSGGGTTPAKGGSGGNIVGSGGSSQGGASQGGSSQGGSSQGGASQGGSGQGGSGQGGTATGGTGQGGTGGGSTCDAATKQKSTECSTCNKAPPGCDAQLKACQDNTKCVDFNKCLSACADTACAQSCQLQNTEGAIVYWAYSGCGDAACHDQCYCDACSAFKAGPCEDCADSKCANECSACMKDGLCVGLWLCITYCGQGDTACMGACQQDATLKGGLTNLMAFIGTQGGCVPGQCGTVCQ